MGLGFRKACARLVEIIESTPLDPLEGEAEGLLEEAGDQFLPLLKEVLGQVPHVILTGERRAQPDEQGRGPPLQGPPAASFHVPGAGSMGMVSFRGPPSAGPPPLLLDDETLEAVSRAVIGRLDVVDLIGRNTAMEAAERAPRSRLRVPF
ncbi:hypothetical protein GPECTOR_57g448 [Gonium pectorale]|uniref:Uncharacterized protein n=1 Tax=Gonium pectorale TaxID=33097 RepID=A0A150G5R6_GONPE|nr:hypothetical protein GPECTOR_57g448 [Gonium pectorale]|eukprot:KXZ45158.1 hypothetical protein GPECTOR_57g448 [Gonium pectorale]